MASEKISQLTTLSNPPMSTTYIETMDTTDTSMASSGTNKKNTLATASYSPATKVVAPQGSGFAADYYTDGTADDVQIQQALDSFFSSTLTFNGLPNVNDTIVLGSDTYTFVASGATGFQVNIAASGALTAANLLTVFNAQNTNTGLVMSVNSTVATITSKVVNITNNATNVVLLYGGGGTLLIKKGNYDITTRCFVGAKTRIIGDGIDSQLSSNGATSIFLFVSTVSNGNPIYITIENLRFWGANSAHNAIDCGSYGSEFIIRDNWFHKWGTGSKCITTTTNKKFFIQGNFFGGDNFDDSNTNAIDMAINLAATGDVAIIGNDIHQFNTAINGNTEKTQIIGNDIYSGLSGGGTAITLGTVGGGLQVANIIGNTFSNVDYGVKCNQAVVTGGLNIVGNFFRAINKNAVYLRGAYHVVSSNHFQEIAQTGAGNDAAGILLADNAQHCKINNNTIYNTNTNMTYGISVLSVAYDSNNISDNTITGAQTAEINIVSSSTSFGTIQRDSTHTTLRGEASHTFSLGRNSTGAGVGLTIQAGGALLGSTDTVGGQLILASGTSTGAVGSFISLLVARDSQGAGTADRGPVEMVRLTSSPNGRLVLGRDFSTSGFSVDGISMTGGVARTIQVHKNSTSGAAGLNLTITAGGANTVAPGTDQAGGVLVLQSGLSTGTATSSIQFQTPTPGSTGTTSTSLATRMTIASTGITNTVPLNLVAGTTTIAPLVFTSGSKLSSPEDGAMEYDGNHLYYTIGSTRYQIDQQLTANQQSDFSTGFLLMGA